MGPREAKILKVLIVDDDNLISECLKVLLEESKEFDVVGTAGNGQEAYEICLKEEPDIVLMDISMPVIDGVIGTKLIKSRFPHVKVVVMNDNRDSDKVKEAMDSGAEDFIRKGKSIRGIVNSLQSMKFDLVKEEC